MTTIHAGPCMVGYRYPTVGEAVAALERVLPGRVIIRDLKKMGSRRIDLMPDGWVYPYPGWTCDMPVASLIVRVS